jgi:long-chain fatty acid transport protein
VVGLLAVTAEAGAAGFHVHEQGAKAMAMANAFVAQADDPSAIFFNPAGLGFLEGTQFSLGLTTILVPETSFTGRALFTPDTQENAKRDIFFPPNIYFSQSLADLPLTWGIGVNSTYPLAKRWDADSAFRVAVKEISIKPININPTLAYRFDNLNLAIGGGIDYTYAWVEKVRNDPSDLGEADLEGDGDGWGYNLGLLWKPCPWGSIGLAYRSEIALDIDGELNRQAFAGSPLPSFTADATTAITLPDTFSLGVAIKPLEKLTIEIDADRFGWSSYDALNIYYSNFSVAAAAAAYPFGSAVPGAELTPKNWKDVWAYRLGAQYRLTDTWDLRCGYAFDNSPVPDSTLAPDLPDADRHNFTVGFGYNQDWGSIDAAYMYVLFKDRTVANSIQDGTYKSDVHLFGLNVTLTF